MKGGINEMKGNCDSWNGFLGSDFLGADDVSSEDQIFICYNVEMDEENNRPILLLESQGKKSKFSLNVTNANFVKNSGVKSPKDALGKQITFKKVMVRNPKTKMEVEGLRIKSVK